MKKKEQPKISIVSSTKNATKETATKSSEVLSGEKEPPGFLGFKFDRPIKGEDFLGETSKKLIEENKLRQREEAQANTKERTKESTKGVTKERTK